MTIVIGAMHMPEMGDRAIYDNHMDNSDGGRVYANANEIACGFIGDSESLMTTCMMRMAIFSIILEILVMMVQTINLKTRRRAMIARKC